MATKLACFVLVSMISVLLAAPVDPDEPSPKKIRLSKDSGSQPSEGHQAASVPEAAPLNSADRIRQTLVQSKWKQILQSLSQPDADVALYFRNKNELLTAAYAKTLSKSVAGKLVQTVITNSGMKSSDKTEIITDLMTNSAQTFASDTVISDISEQVIPLAVKQRDPVLLRHLVEEMHLPLTDHKASILVDILDSNPFSRCSMPRFWQTMEYLISKGSDFIKIPPRNPHRAAVPLANLLPPANLLDTPASDLLLGRKVSAVNIANVKSLSAPLEEFPPNLQHFRRNLVLNGRRTKNCLTQILLKYRGIDTLLPQERMAYERSVLKALDRDFRQKTIGVDAEEYIVKLATDNIAMDVDALFTKNLFSEMISRSKDPNRLKRVISDNFERGVDTSANTESEHIYEWAARTTRAQVYSDSTQKSIKTLKQHLVNKLDLGPCPGLSRRRRRSPLNCLISEEEYNKFVKVEENIDGEQKKILDTEKFMEIMSAAEYSDQPKYEQLIDVGRNLLENEGAILDGDYTANVMEKVLPNSLESNPGSQNHLEPKSNFDESFHVKSSEQFQPLDIFNKPINEPMFPLIHGNLGENRPPMPNTYLNGLTDFGEHAPNSEIITPHEVMAPHDILREPVITFTHQELPKIIEPIQLPDIPITFHEPLPNIHPIEIPHTVVEPIINIPHEYIPPPRITPIRFGKYG